MRAPLGEAFGIGKHVELFDVAPGEVLMGETSRAPVIRAWDPIGPLPACGPSNGSSIDERRGQSSALHDQRVGLGPCRQHPGDDPACA